MTSEEMEKRLKAAEGALEALGKRVRFVVVRSYLRTVSREPSSLD
ncbi:MAG: hypothetical protein OEW82_08945 [Dehalococcoidia bacterium]|jgi:hypothetical protein|nr:hypothetical protein [Dehalococcoidia bacterium]